MRDAIRAEGLTCEAVTGEMGKRERDRIVRDFRAGRIRCLVSVGVLSTGFNVPEVDLIALLRPTQSAGLYVQQVGRALRRAPGKADAIVLD
ncbi:helicase-related protein, partial [Burkholderia pseudomallei]